MEPTTTTHGDGNGGGDSPPFWPPSTTISRRRNSPSLLLNPAFLIVFLPILFFILIFFLVLPFLNFTSQIVKPSTHTMKKGGGGGGSGSVKRGWDLFNVLLVLFAVLCGIFAKRTANDDTSSTTTDSNSTSVSDDVTNMNMKTDRVLSSNRWFDGDDDDTNRNHHRFFSDRVSERSDVHQMRRMNGGSVYSDLRHDAVLPMMNGDGSGNGSDERFKFFDDFDINRYRRLEANNVGDDEVVGPIHRRRRSMGELSELKPMPIDKFVVTSSTESPPPPSDNASPVEETVPPPPAQSLPVRKPRKTTYRTVSSRRADVQKRARSPPPATSSPPLAPNSPPLSPSAEVIVPPLVEESVKVEKKKKKSSNASKEIKTVLASIYNPVKRKKKYKTKIIIEDSVRSEPDIPVDSSSPSTQPPPPPPLPPSVFSLFKKSSKNKKIHSVPPPVPPPRFSLNRQNTPLPPPPPSQPQPRASVSQRRTHSTTKGRPPLPNKNNNVDRETLNSNSNSNSGGQSPLIPMPPPPPLPPFQVSEMKFTVKDDYVRVKSGPSTRCSSPELDSSSASNVMDSADVAAQPSSVFCPSPDVNVKADTFIARLRDEWKNDKINSLKGKQKLGQVSGSKSFN